MHYRVEECVVDDDHERGHHVVDLVELLEDHVVLADLVLFVGFVGFVIFSQVLGELVEAIVSVVLVG